MHPVDFYHDQHEALLVLVGDLRPLLNAESLKVRPAARGARKLLREITDKLKEHLASEDKELYPAFLAHEDEQIRTTAWGFISGQHALRHWTDQYQRKWLRDDDLELAEDFLKDTNELLELLAVRVEREERFLFPRLEGKTA